MRNGALGIYSPKSFDDGYTFDLGTYVWRKIDTGEREKQNNYLTGDAGKRKIRHGVKNQGGTTADRQRKCHGPPVVLRLRGLIAPGVH